MKINSISVKKNVLKRDLKFNGVTLLTYTIEYPKFCSFRFCRCLHLVNKFYRKKALKFQRYCETELFPMAIEQYEDDIENNFPIHVFEAMQVYEVTYLNECIISIYFDQYQYTGGAHGNTTRQSQTWNLRECKLIKLRHLVQCPPDYKTYILSEVEAQIKNCPDIYFENYQELIAETFNKNSFYCTNKGIMVYYQQYDIAPYSSGIREFLLPYSNCVVNPKTLCRKL